MEILPLERSVLECRKGHLGGRKGQIVNLGPKTPKTAKMPTKRGKKRKTNKTTIGLITGMSFNFGKDDSKIGKNQPVCKPGALRKARPRKVRFSSDFLGGFDFSQERLFSRNSTRKPLNLLESPIFTHAPCKSTCLYNAPSIHTVKIRKGKNWGHSGLEGFA